MKPSATPHVPKEKLFEEFSTVIAETELLLKSVADAGTGKAGSIRTSVEQSLEAATKRLAGIREESVRQATAAARATDEYVQENPWRALGIVAAAAAIGGIIAGLLVARR